MCFGPVAAQSGRRARFVVFRALREIFRFSREIVAIPLPPRLGPMAVQSGRHLLREIFVLPLDPPSALRGCQFFSFEFNPLREESPLRNK